MKIRPWNENDWDTLIRAVRKGQVIPVIGETLSQVSVGQDDRAWVELVAEQMLLEGLLDSLPEGRFNLQSLAGHHVRCGGDPLDMQDALLRIGEELTVPPASVLRQLAELTDCRLYVSLGVDTLLAQAVKEARSSEFITHKVYRPGESDDLPTDWPLSNPLIYHLFGKISALPDYVVSHEDMLEFMHALQSDLKKPQELFSRLSRCSLLVLGSALADWLALFFWRMASHQRLSHRSTQIIMVDDGVDQRPDLAGFITQIRNTRIRLVGMSAKEFVGELHHRWISEQQQKDEAQPQDADVFISYANEDRPQAEAIRAGLLEHYPRLGIWLDKQGGLACGDDYTRKIYRQIATARVFIALIPSSAPSGDDGNRFYRKEWAWAEAREFELGEIPFVLPVIGGSEPDYQRSDLPELFRSKHWHHLPAGQVDSDFARQVVKVIQQHKKREAA